MLESQHVKTSGNFVVTFRSSNHLRRSKGNNPPGSAHAIRSMDFRASGISDDGRRGRAFSGAAQIVPLQHSGFGHISVARLLHCAVL